MSSRIPTPWPNPAAPPASGLAGLAITAAGVGIHHPAAMARHSDRTMEVHELVMVEAGALPIAEVDQDHTVPAGQWILLRAGLRHRGTDHIDDETWFRWVCFTTPGQDLSDGPTPNGIVRDRAEARMLFHRFLHHQDEGTLTQQAADALTSLLLHQLGPPTTPEEDNHRRLRRLVDQHLAAHLDDPALSTGTVAAALGYHPDHLGRAYRAVTGHTIVTAIHLRRVEGARRLLRTTCQPIARVAVASGFQDQTWFRTVFQRITGVAPADYRTIHTNP